MSSLLQPDAALRGADDVGLLLAVAGVLADAVGDGGRLDLEHVGGPGQLGGRLQLGGLHRYNAV